MHIFANRGNASHIPMYICKYVCNCIYVYVRMYIYTCNGALAISGSNKRANGKLTNQRQRQQQPHRQQSTQQIGLTCRNDKLSHL